MSDPRDSVELTSRPQAPSNGESGRADATHTPRPWLGLVFRCSGVYGRAYRNAEGTGYFGRCPSCGKTVRFSVGEGGTSERLFHVNC